MTRNSKLILVGVLAIISVGVALSVLFRGRLQQANANERFEQNQQEAGSALEVATYEPLGSSRANIEEVADQLASQGATDAERARRREAVLSAHDFLVSRFGHHVDPASRAAYIAFAQRQIASGASLKSDLAFNTSFANYYESVVGRPPAADGDPAELFADLASAEDGRNNRVSVPTAIGVNPEAVGVALGRYSQANPAWPMPRGATNDAIAYSVSTVSHRPLWSRPDDLQAQLERDGADVAQVHFFLEFAPGNRRACLVNLVWSERAGGWIVASTAVTRNSMEVDDAVRWAY